MANAIGNNGGRFYSFAAQPVLIDCNFIVDSANGNGYGNRTLKGQGVKAVYMNTSAAITGTVATTANQITAISQGTSSLKAGMPVQGTGIAAGTTITAILSSSAVQISSTPTGNHSSESITYQAVGSPNPAAGYALIHLTSNYNRYMGGFSGFVSPSTGGTIAINSTSLTPGLPYVIASVGAGADGSATISPVADSNGSLASTYFTLYDSYGNVFVIWFYVTSVGGSAPTFLGPQVQAGQRGLQYVQQTIAENATAANITTALAATIALLPSGIVGTDSFTTSGGGTATLTVTSTLAAPLAGIPQDGTINISASNTAQLPIVFTVTTASASANSVWTDGFGNLYTVSANLSSGTTLHTTGAQMPGASAGTLTYVSGSGSTTAIAYSAAVAGFATGFTFALVNFNSNLNCWTGVGVKPGVVPAVGVPFIATSSGVSTGGGSSGTVVAAGVSGITSIEVIGNTNLAISPIATGYSANVGGWVLVQFLGSTSSSVTTLAPTAPANNSVVGMSFYVDARLSPSENFARYA
jgi:hypothetical protein